MSSSVINKIYERISYLRSQSSVPGTTIEVESRLGRFTYRGFNPNIPRAKWLMAVQKMDSLPLAKKEYHIISTSYTGMGVRTQSITVDGVTSNVIQGKYSTVDLDDDMDNWVRYSFSVEVPLKELPKNIVSVPYVRDIQRTRYIMNRFSCYVDMSRITTNGYVSHQIEIEMMSSGVKNGLIKEFIDCTRIITKMMNGTQQYYNVTGLSLLIGMINMNLPTESNVKDINIEYVDKLIMADPQPLSMKHFVKGGIFNESLLYCLSQKIDGTHYMLVLTSNSIWLISPPYKYNLLTTQVNAIISPNEITILEVEVIDTETVPDVYVIDCFTVAGLDVRQLDKGERMRKGKSFVDELYRRRVKVEVSGPDLMTVSDARDEEYSPYHFIATFPNTFNLYWKSYHVFRTVLEFYSLINSLLSEQLDYPTDGLTLTPWNHPYDFSRSVGRIVEGKPPILKWKPPHKVTIDLRIIMDGEDVLLMMDNRPGPPDEVPFNGTIKYPFNSQMIDIESIPSSGYGSIGEFRWDYTRKLLVYERSRDLKSSPNHRTTCVSNWKLIQDPITVETLTGVGLNQLRFYHNRTKDVLIDSSYGILLDFGTGRGGDMKKMARKYRLVFAVEPDLDNIAVLRERALSTGFIIREIGDDISINANMIIIIHGYAQDTMKITNAIKSTLNPRNDPTICDQVNAVSMMDSGTFFWENAQVLEAVCKTINTNLKSGGKVLWKMMDGDAVRSTIAKQRGIKPWLAFNYQPTQYDIVDYGDFIITPTGNSNQVVFTFKGGITGEQQTEYLTRITDMYYMLGNNYRPLSQDRIDDSGQYILTGDSFNASRLYLYGVILKAGEDYRKTPLFDDIVPSQDQYPLLPSIMPSMTFQSLQPAPPTNIISRATGKIGVSSTQRENTPHTVVSRRGMNKARRGASYGVQYNK